MARGQQRPRRHRERRLLVSPAAAGARARSPRAGLPEHVDGPAGRAHPYQALLGCVASSQVRDRSTSSRAEASRPRYGAPQPTMPGIFAVPRADPLALRRLRPGSVRGSGPVAASSARNSMMTVLLSAGRAAPGANSGTVRVLAIARVSLDRPFAVEQPDELRDLIAALASRLATAARRIAPRQ